MWWQSVVEGDPDEAVGQRRGPLSSAVELPEGQDDYSLRFWGIDGRLSAWTAHPIASSILLSATSLGRSVRIGAVHSTREGEDGHLEGIESEVRPPHTTRPYPTQCPISYNTLFSERE